MRTTNLHLLISNGVSTFENLPLAEAIAPILLLTSSSCIVQWGLHQMSPCMVLLALSLLSVETLYLFCSIVWLVSDLPIDRLDGAVVYSMEQQNSALLKCNWLLNNWLVSLYLVAAALHLYLILLCSRRICFLASLRKTARRCRVCKSCCINLNCNKLQQLAQQNGKRMRLVAAESCPIGSFRQNRGLDVDDEELSDSETREFEILQCPDNGVYSTPEFMF